jgi:hypothetical protein
MVQWVKCVAAAIVLALACGCEASATTAAPSKPAVVFPTRDEVAKLPSLPPRVEAFGADDVIVDSWSFESPIGSDGTAYDDSSAWGDLARRIAEQHAATTALSGPLRCAGQELARFHLQKHAVPAESLRRFVVARCGATVANVYPMVWYATAPRSMTDEELAPKVRDGLAKFLDERLATGHSLLGVGAARDEQRISVVIVVAQDLARIEPGLRSVDASRHVTLRGSARGELATLTALINQGDVGTARCSPEPGVAPPAFAFTCSLAPGDAFAWVEILGQRRGHLLHEEVAETIVYEGDGSAVTYAARSMGPPAPVGSAQDFTSALVDRLNRVRKSANLAELTLAGEQSLENARLVGTLIDAGVGKDDGAADRAAIGLLAGWDVHGLIRNAAFFVGAVAPTRDVNAWLDFALERPMGRAALLDPEARQIAVGPAVPEGVQALGAAVTTYALFESDDHSADEARFFERVAAERRLRGLPAPVRVAGGDAMRAECARVQREGKPPMAGLRSMMQTAVSRTGESVAGYVLEANDLEHVEVPEPLLARGALKTILVVTHHRAPGAAWGQYVVFALVLGGGSAPVEQARARDLLRL